MNTTKPQPDKPCLHCGNPIVWKKNLAKVWATTLYCSNACIRVANRHKRQAGEHVGVPPREFPQGIRGQPAKKPKNYG